MRFLKHSLLIVLLVAAAACAPENLDITPSPTATNTPEPTSTPRPTNTPDPAAQGVEATEEVIVSESQALLDQLVAAVPARISGGALLWARTRDEVVYSEVDGGITATISMSEPGGSEADLTFGVFETPEAAQAFYDEVLGRVRSLENAETRDIFPTPNAFGGGTYGSDAIFVQGNLYIRISIPQFSSTAGEPLSPLARSVFQIVNGVTGAS